MVTKIYKFFFGECTKYDEACTSLIKAERKIKEIKVAKVTLPDLDNPKLQNGLEK